MSDELRKAARLLVYHEKLLRGLDAAGGDEIKTLQRVVSYLSNTGVPAGMTAPLMRMLGRAHDAQIKVLRAQKSGAARPVAEMLALMTCAAAVTVKKERGMRVTDAMKAVARESAFDQKVLCSFRDNLNRGLMAHWVSAAYEKMMDELREVPDDEIIRRVKDLRNLLFTPAKANT